MLQPFERSKQNIASSDTPHTLAIKQPTNRALMTALVIATSARGDFILDPTRTTFDARDDVLRRRSVQGGIKGRGAPNAIGTVAFQNAVHTFAAIELTHGRIVQC
jgi:hypothetical protein